MRRRSVIGRVPTPLKPTLVGLDRVGRAERSLRVVLLSQYFSPEIGATQARMQSFAEYLAARGHRVTVVSEFPNHPVGVIPESFRGHLYVDDRANPYRVLRVWVRASPEKTQARRMAFYLSYMALATAAAPLVGRADVVVATSPPLFVGLAGLAMARLKRAPLVLDVRDLWPAAAVSLNQIGGGAQLRAGEALERLLYRRAARVVCVTRPFCSHVDAITGGPPAAYIPNGTLELFFVEDGGSRERLGISVDDFLVTFAGTHGIAQALPSVLDAAERLSRRVAFALVGEGPVKTEVMRAAAERLNRRVTFALVGEGPVKAELMRDAESRGLENVRFHPEVPLEDIVPVLAASDALLVPLVAHPTFADFVPSKMIDYMAVGRPVLLAAAGEAARLLDESGGGIVVAPEDPEGLARAVQWLAEHPEEADAMGRRGREFARTRLRSVQAERLEQLLLDVVERR
jgi:glycosyltransferase involved in cell wall biosynthesis